jgi:cell division protein FtsB
MKPSMPAAMPSSGSDAKLIGLGSWSAAFFAKGPAMRWLLAVLLTLLVALQYRLWVGQGSLAELRSFKQEIALQEVEIKRLQARNQELQAEVEDLGRGLEAVEERARSELGMIKPGEIFIQVIEPPKPETKR